MGKNAHAPKKSTENRFLQIPFLIQAMAFMRDFVHQLKSFLFVFFVERIQEGKKYSRSSVESSQSIIFHYYFLSRDPDQGQNESSESSVCLSLVVPSALAASLRRSY